MKNVHPGQDWCENDGHCSYCGSLSVAKAVSALKTKGTSYSGADFKYGWPHKFYIGWGKFYNAHLLGCNDEEFSQFNELCRKYFHINFIRDNEGLKYQAPETTSFYGYQAFGVVE